MRSFSSICCTAFVAAFLCLSHSSRAAAADWPGFRGPNHDGVSTDEKIPTKWGDEKNLKWKVELPGAGVSSPIVVGKRVFVTCFSGRGDSLKRHLVCVDRTTGKIAWKKAVASDGPAGRAGGFGSNHGYASHTPVSDGKNVYVMFGTTGAIAFDLTGKQLWKTNVGRESKSRFGSAASPILFKGTLIVTAANESATIRGLDTKTGKEVWKASAGSLSGSYSTPIIAKNTDGVDQLLVSVTYEIWALSPKTGKLKWYAETQVDTAACTAIVIDGTTAYVVGGRSGGRTAVTIGGKGDVTKTNVKWSMRGGSYVSSPVLYKGHLYWTNGAIAHCVEAKTGKEVGRKRLGGTFYASITLIKDKLVAVTRYGGTYVLEASPKLTQLAHNKFSDTSEFSASPAVSDGQLFLRSNKYLYCIEAK